MIVKSITGCKTELLAPAGDYDCFLAAINAGADAVYAGGEVFSARAYASNFSNEELIAAIDHAHLYDRRLYLTVNTILKNNETLRLYDYISPLYEAGLDGVIVQDIGVIRILKELFPDLALHASTQMAITDSEGVMLLKDMGIKRVVPARELSLDELKGIHDETGMELECFIHGAMCYSYSGKCLFSSMLGKRSGNRGRCAGPCRLPYNNSYLLSLRDISAIDIIPELIKAGIASFKIEGRMKSKEYVAGVTGIYRKYIDKYLSNGTEEYRVSDDDRNDLEELYTRSGHCSGYYYQHNGRSMITLDRPSYDTADDVRMEELYRLYTSYSGKLKIHGKAFLEQGRPLVLTLCHKDHTISYQGDIVSAAKTRPMSTEDIKKQLYKLGDTCFELSDFEIYADDNVFLPVSALNAARREAIRLLSREILYGYKRHKKIGNDIITDNGNTQHEFSCSIPLVNCRIDNLELLDTILSYEYIDIVTLDMNSLSGITLREISDIISMIRNTGRQVYIALPCIIRNGYLKHNTVLDGIIKSDMADGIVADNYEVLYYLSRSEYKGKVLSDLHMYAANDVAVSELQRLGVNIITYPVELNSRELKGLMLYGGEFILYGRYPMMVSAQCIKKTNGKCDHNSNVSYIRDRLGNHFPCVSRCNECYNTILNCVPTMITAINDLPDNLYPYSYRLHFTIEDNEEAETILRMYNDVFNGREVRLSDSDHTLGHLKRGVE